MENFVCDVCGKKFSREDNLREHKKKHLLFQCGCCNCAFATSENLQFHQNFKHNQTGGARKRKADSPQPGPSFKKIVGKNDNPKDFYRITPTGERRMRKFNTTMKQYRINFEQLEIRNLSNILASLNNIFNSIIKEITQFMSPTDLVRLTVQCPELDYPISIPFIRLSNMTAERLLSEIERVLQSYEEFVIDQSLQIELTHVRLPSGSGHKKKCYINLEKTITEKRSVIKIRNKDVLCCARAIITAKAQIDKHPKWNSIRQGRSIQKTLAEELHSIASVPFKRCDVSDVKIFQTFLPDYQIFVLSKDAFNAIVYKGPEAEKKIFLYLHDEHYDVISSITGFLERSYFCSKCNKGYNKKEKHICNDPCHYCHHCHSDQKEEWQYCKKCNRHFKNRTCFELHAKLNRHGNSTCKSYYRCKKCSTSVNIALSSDEHVCGQAYCNICKSFKPSDHLCYMKPSVENENKNKKGKVFDNDDHKKWIFFDFECTQDEMIQCKQGYQQKLLIVCRNCDKVNCHSNPCLHGYVPKQTLTCKNCNDTSCGTYRHVPNLCVVHKVCEICLDEEDIDECSFCSFCKQKQVIFQGKNTRDNFCKWLFSEENVGSKIFCHNLKGYDSYPIVSYLYENAILPEVIMNGSKFMSIEIPHLKMRFIDSINFIPMALSKIPKAFELIELTKGYFPHLFNKTKNQNIILNHLPDIKYYNPECMMPDTQKTFMKWYQIHKNDKFDFQKELLKYCLSDVDILRRGCLKFRKLFIDMTSTGDAIGIDPFEHCITIASACNLVFRKLFLEENSIGIIPPHGYNPKDRQSIKAMQWIKYMSFLLGVNIQHAGNVGEKIIGSYKVDGYYETDDQKVVLEFHGDYWHGNPKCYAANTMNKVLNVTMGDLFQKTLEKRKFIESQGYVYKEMWESDFNDLLNKDENVKQFVDDLELVSPLRPRDAFFGGRTEAFKLFEEATKETQIKCYDVTSLYPFINKTGKVPLGHPEIITDNFESIDNYEGLIKCKILPPRNLHIPVLPAKLNGKLLFGLCKTCMTKHQTFPCQHNDHDRALIGTWVTDEVKKAIQMGYCLKKIYEVWHFRKISQYDSNTKKGGVFTEYVNTFLKMKQEASGWPLWCKDEKDKHSYIAHYFHKEGIQLEYDQIHQNSGLRSLAKLMLNSFWGKFGQRENMPQISYVTEPAAYFDMLTSDYQEVKDVSYVSEEMVRIQWVMGEDFIETSGRTNCIIAAYTTAQARLKLYSYLEKLGDRVLYVDTDSIIFTTNSKLWEPSLGDYLGDLTDEVAGEKITSFVTGGPKNYAYITQDKHGKTKSVCKVKGITLNFKNCIDINFDTIKEMVQNNRSAKLTVLNEYKITRDIKKMDIITQAEEKDYKIVFDKRVLNEDLTSKPYGM